LLTLASYDTYELPVKSVSVNCLIWHQLALVSQQIFEMNPLTFLWWLQIRRLMGGTLMYERETDEATRQAVSCYCVNAYSNPHHSQHTPCVCSAWYSQNIIQGATITHISLKYLTHLHLVLLHAPVPWWRSKKLCQ